MRPEISKKNIERLQKWTFLDNGHTGCLTSTEIQRGGKRLYTIDQALGDLLSDAGV
ncbi:MAG: hypothetical protein ACYDAO_04350 [Thermoplasmataceae archaeon]